MDSAPFTPNNLRRNAPYFSGTHILCGGDFE
jgi:hypothetical protein